MYKAGVALKRKIALPLFNTMKVPAGAKKKIYEIPKFQSSTLISAAYLCMW